MSLFKTFMLMLICMMIGISGNYLLKEVESFQSSILFFPIVAVFRSLTCCYYIILGKILYNIYCKVREYRWCSIFLCIICIICFALSFVCSSTIKGYDFSMLNLGEYPFFVFLCGTVGTVWVIILFYYLRKVYSFPILKYVGRNSMIIMGTHMSMLLTIFVPFIVNYFVHVEKAPTFEYYLFGAVCVIFIIIIEIPIINLLNGKFNCLIKKL